MRDAWALEMFFKLLAYHGIMFLASAVHTTPNQPPFGLLLYVMRFIALYGFITDCMLLHHWSTLNKHDCMIWKCTAVITGSDE